jgi:hypothetical protein
MGSPPKEATHLLINWSPGDKEALAQQMPLVYDELHRSAAGYLHRHRPIIRFRLRASFTKHISGLWTRRM